MNVQQQPFPAGTIESLRALVFETMGDAVIVLSLDGLVVDWNPAAERMFGYSRAEMLGRSPSVIHPPALRETRPLEIRAAVTRDGRWAGEIVYQRKDGHQGIADVVVAMHYDCEGRPVGIIGVNRDVTDRRSVQRALEESEERYRLVSRATNDLVYDWDILAGTLTWNEAMSTAFLHPPSARSVDIPWWESNIHPDDLARVNASLTRAIESGADLWAEEYRFRRGNGEWAFVLDRGSIRRDAEGRAVRMVGLLVDLTERRQLEDQLRQAQKMEAVGQLAGGIAHDFNNIVTAVQLHTEFLLEALHASDPRRRDAEEIARASARAVGLTRQLLAFSRKQLLSPTLLDLSDTVRETVKMLRRLIGEDIMITTALAHDLWPVHADAGQLEQVLINLALNARDAMPGGGRLTIETANAQLGETSVAYFATIPAGSYTRLTVRDNGTGMDSATRARVFEPFFTTKAVGEGTGLGLAMVYGIVKQSGGFILVDSTPGVGTDFSVYLPRAKREGGCAEEPVAVAAPARGAETVLLVEDEEAVRALARRVLQRQGYRVLEARNGREALATAASHPGEIHLLLTDAVMPEMGGVELVSEMRSLRPDLRVLLMSGYTNDDVDRRGGAAGANVTFLQKPFTMHQLAALVRSVIDAAA